MISIPRREAVSFVRYGVRMRLGLVVVASVALAGCAASADFESETEDFIDMPTPPGNCSADTGAEPCPNPTADGGTGTSGNPVGGPCLEPDDCQAGAACVAPYEDGMVGEFSCTDQCIALEDEASWCLDAAACCEPGAICRRGLCVIDGSADSGSGDSGSGDSGSGDSDSGSGDSGGSSSTGV